MRKRASACGINSSFIMELPGGTCGNPMTYSINGKQYIAVSVGSRTTTAEIVALALP